MKPMVPPAPEGPIDSIRQPYMENIRCWSDVAEILKRELISQQKLELITENHVCFHPLKTFGEVWNIHKTALKNFVTLLCGYLQFPFILLQNPCKTHTLDYEEMLRRSPTLSLLSVALYEIGLTLDEVPTFDICSLFSDEDLSQMDEENRDRAVEESYALVEGVLRILRPRIVIVCQCVTNQGKWKSGQDGEKLWSWKPARNPLARELCSSLTAFRNYEVQEVSLGNHVIYAVKGRHPIGVIRYDDEDGGGRLKFQALIRQMFVPCANIQRLELAEALTKVIGPADSVVTAIHARHRGPDSKLENLFDALALSVSEFSVSLDAAAKKLQWLARQLAEDRPRSPYTSHHDIMRHGAGNLYNAYPAIARNEMFGCNPILLQTSGV